MQRWTRATEALRQEPDKYKPGQTLKLRKDQLQKRSANFQNKPFSIKEAQEVLYSTMDDDPLFWFMLITLPIVYGSVHLTAWKFDFPSRVEQIMWRVACIIIAGGILGLCTGVGTIFALREAGDRIFGKGWINKKTDKRVELILLTMCQIWDWGTVKNRERFSSLKCCILVLPTNGRTSSVI